MARAVEVRGLEVSIGHVGAGEVSTGHRSVVALPGLQRIKIGAGEGGSAEIGASDEGVVQRGIRQVAACPLPDLARHARVRPCCSGQPWLPLTRASNLLRAS